MSYVKTTWANGDTITASGLNNMESGIEAASAGGIMDLHITLDETSYATYTVPKSEIDAIIAGVPYAVRIYINSTLSVIAFFGSCLSGNMAFYFSAVPGASVSFEVKLMVGASVVIAGSQYTLDGDVYKYVEQDD